MHSALMHEMLEASAELAFALGFTSHIEYVNAEIAMRDFMILRTPSNTAYQAMHRVNSASDLPGGVGIKKVNTAS